jgi:hypothetical protein
MLVCSTAAVHCRRAPRCFLHDMMQRHFISKPSMHKRCNITQWPAQSDRCRRLGPPAGRRVRPAALRRRLRCADVRTIAVTAKSKRTCGIITLRRLCKDPTTAIVARAARASTVALPQAKPRGGVGVSDGRQEALGRAIRRGRGRGPCDADRSACSHLPGTQGLRRGCTIVH